MLFEIENSNSNSNLNSRKKIEKKIRRSHRPVPLG
jgi:hypothetical protein